MSDVKRIVRYADNTNISDLGIFKFARECFPKRFSYPFSDVHFIMAKLLLRLLDPSLTYVMQRQAYMLVHREAAKTTIGTFLFPIYLIYMKGREILIGSDILNWDKKTKEENKQYLTSAGNIKIRLEENFILITSQTQTRAGTFVSDLKYTLEERSDLAALFGEKDPRVIQAKEEERRKSAKLWRVSSFITADDTVIWAVGSGQHTRGINIKGSRPTMIICDDLYSMENTKTEEAITNINKWFRTELSNTADSRKGKILVLGTLVHRDIIIKELMESSQWFGVSRPIVSMSELKLIIRYCTDSEGRINIPPLHKSQEFDNTLKTLSWKSHKGSYFIISKYKECKDTFKLDYFYQEFMNEDIAPETRMIEPDAFMPCPIEFYIKDNRQMCSFEYNNVNWFGICKLYLGLDPASSQSNTSDDTVISVAGLARCYPIHYGIDVESSIKSVKEGIIFPVLAHIEGGKYSIHNYKDLPGMCESIYEITKRYKLEYANVEGNSQQVQIFREIETYMSSHSANVTIWCEPSSGKKFERILSILLPYFHRYKRMLCNVNDNICDRLYNQLLTCGKSVHDDWIDSLSIAMKYTTEPEFVSYQGTSQSTPSTTNKLQRLIDTYGADYWYYL